MFPIGNSDDADDARVLLALFDEDVPLPPILDKLRAEGLPQEALDVMSSSPLPESVGGTVRTGLVPLALTGGAIGIGVGLFFAAGTAAMYPLMTGGKPIVALPIVGIVSYETMMLGAVSVTFLAMALKLLASRRKAALHDPRIYEGMVGVAVKVGREDPGVQAIERLLIDSGAAEVRYLGNGEAS